MAVYLSLDSGGSKCAAILFDDEMHLLGSGLAKGTNTNHTSWEEACANVGQCIDQVLGGLSLNQIDCFYYSSCGPKQIILQEVEKRIPVAKAIAIGEDESGLYAGAMLEEGILALSGTGSDIFWVGHRGTGSRTTVGAWGPILGDQGSGTWMGVRALREAIRSSDGWGEKTLILDYLREEWKLQQDWDIVGIIHGDPAPFRKAATCTKIIGRAARAGDALALRILREAGEVMAMQTICLIEKNQIPPEKRIVTCCGGAWKAHEAMFQRFRERLIEKYPDMQVQKPWYEQVMAGPVKVLLDRGMEREAAKELLDASFPDFRIRW